MSPRCAFRLCPAALALALGLCATLSAQAQDKPAVVDIIPASTDQAKPALVAPITTSKPPDFSKEALVFDKLITHIREEFDGTGTRQTTARIRILADAGVKEMAVLQFTYTASNQQVDIAYVRVIKPDGTVVVTPPYNVQDLPADVTRSAPMYSDIHQKHVAVKGLGVGDVLEYQFTLATLKPEVPGHFWFEYSFQKDLIVLDEQVDLDLPADKTVTVASVHDDPQPAITTAANRKLYHWSSSNLARPDPDAPPKSVKHWKPSIQVTTFSSWEQVGSWYQSLQRESLTVTPAVQAKATALTKGLTSDEDKTRAIFNDVALHIHYVGLEFGIGRYQPHPADDVLSNEYGDCKDKHTLLASELKAIGIDSWPVLISSIRELDPATPSPSQFDHVITLVPLAGKLLWMDSTEEVAPIGELTGTLRDKQALAIPNGKPSYLERTLIDLPFTQSARFESSGKLSEQGVYTGHITQSYHGDVELFLRAILREVPQSQLKEAMQRFSQGMGFTGEVSNPKISEIEQTSLPLEFSYDYTREKFGEWENHRIFPSMPSTGWALQPGVKEKKPADEIEIGSPGEQVYVSNVTLPKGWSLVPQQGIDLKQDWAEYHSTYGLKDGVFSAERRIVLKKNKVPLDDWDKYLNFRRAVYADEVQTTYLMSSNSSADFQGRLAAAAAPQISHVPSTNGIPSDEIKQQLMTAMEPLRDASTLLESDTALSADDLIKASAAAHKAVEAIEAKTIDLPDDDPHSLYWTQVLGDAWCLLGWSALEESKLPAAESYLRAAWRLSQDRTSGYQLGRLFQAQGNKAAAAHQFELASAASINDAYGGFLSSAYKVDDRIKADYRSVTGKPLAATALNNGQYNGSLRAELDKEIEIRPLVRVTKLNGQAFFIVVLEAGKPVKARWIGGDKPLDSLVPTIQAHAFGSALPAGSKARLLRELRAVCTEWAGCDAYILVPTAIQIPATQISHDITPANAPTRTKTVRIEVAHRVGGGITPAVLPHHRTCRSASGGS